MAVGERQNREARESDAVQLRWLARLLRGWEYGSVKIGYIFSSFLCICLLREGVSQDLTVKVFEQSTSQPVRNALVRLHYGCMRSMRPIELKARTDAMSIAVFPSVSLTPLELCVLPDYDFDTREQTGLFASPKNGIAEKYSGQVVDSLPNTLTFHVRRLSFFENLRKLFSYSAACGWLDFAAGDNGEHDGAARGDRRTAGDLLRTEHGLASGR